MAYEVFICHASQDKAVADAVCAILEGTGIQCWMAPRDVPAGKWGGAIMEAVAQSRLMVLIFSANSNNSANCLSEVHAAFSKRATIIPLRIDNTVPSGDMEYYLQTYHWLDAQTPPLEMHLQGLANRVTTDLAHAAAREEAAARAKKEAEEAKKAQEAARAKKEAEEAAREKARQEAEATRASQEAEVVAKEEARREAKAIRIKKEAEEAAKEKAKWEVEAARARQEAEEAKKTREAAIQARKEAEEAIKEKKRYEDKAARARKEAEEAQQASEANLKAREEAEKVKKQPKEKRPSKAKAVLLWLGIAVVTAAIIGVALKFTVFTPIESTTTPTAAATTPITTTLASTNTTITTLATTPSTTSTATTPTISTTTTTSTTPAWSVSVLGCPQGSPTPGLVPQYGGTLKILYSQNVTNLGAPWKINTVPDKMLNRFAIENLVGLDANGQPIPQLATSWVSDIANKTITFTLREGVKFHDGTPFNAIAAKWCLDKYRTTGELTDLKLLTSVDVIGDYQLKLTLSTWDPTFLSNLSSTGAGKMTSPTAAEKMGDDIMRNPVGTGPFRFVSFQPNVSLKYTNWGDYWQKGLPYLDGVEINFIADPVVSLASFTKGWAHVLHGVSPTDAKGLKDNGCTLYQTTLTIMGICGDSIHASSPFANINIRRAIAYAIDVKKDVDAIYGGLMEATNQLALPGLQAYNSSIQGYPYNPDKAKALLEPLGITTAKPLTIDFIYGSDPQRTDLYTLVQVDLAKVGINLTLKPVDRTTLMKLSNAGWTNQLIQYNFPYNGVEMQFSSSVQNNLAADKLGHVSVYTPDAFNSLYQAMNLENDLAKREAYYEQLNKMAIDDYCMVIPLFALQNLIANSPNVHDCGLSNKASSEFLPERAWISK